MARKSYRKSHIALPREGYWGAFLRMLPAIIMVGLVPLIVRESEHENGLTGYAWFGNEPITYDFFLAPKSVVLMLLAFVMAGGIVARFWKEKCKVPFAKILIPLFLYGLLCFLSGCVSIQKEFSFFGGHAHFETVWVLLSYVLIVYYMFLYAANETEQQVVADAICFSATVIGLIGTLQGIGINLFSAMWYQKLITTESFLTRIGGKLTLNFADNTAYATLYNPNYLGVFGSFAVPFLIMLFMFEKNKWRRIWHGASSVLMIVALLSSRSRAGLIAAVAALFVAVIFAIRKVLKRWYLAIPAISFAVVLVLLVNAYNDNVIFERLKNAFAPDNVTIAEEVAEDGTIIRKTGLTEMYTTPEGVAMTYNEVSAMVVLYTDETSYGFYALDETGEQMKLTHNENGTEFYFTHPAYADVMLSPVNSDMGLCMRIKAGKEWDFVYDNEKQSYQYMSEFGKTSDMIMAESFGFEKHQHSFSNRGFIWSRTIPLLKKYIFLGSGPDTFVLAFPQNAYLEMYQNGFGTNIMTKPHCLYLQVGVQTGVLSLICLLVFYGWYAVQCLRLYAFRKLTTQAEAFGMAAFIGSVGYMISGISNDSMVVTAPVFWGMIGLGVVANRLVRKNREQAGKEEGIARK